MTTTTPTPSGLLLATADLIEKHGLARGKFQDAEGRLCPIGALRLAAFGEVTACVPDDFDDTVVSLYWRARTALGAQVELLMPGHRGTPLWSDNSPQDVVVATLRAAAELAGTGVPS